MDKATAHDMMLLFTGKPASAGPVCIRHLDSVITVAADALAPSRARPSAGTVLIETLICFF